MASSALAVAQDRSGKPEGPERSTGVFWGTVSVPWVLLPARLEQLLGVLAERASTHDRAT